MSRRPTRYELTVVASLFGLWMLLAWLLGDLFAAGAMTAVAALAFRWVESRRAQLVSAWWFCFAAGALAVIGGYVAGQPTLVAAGAVAVVAGYVLALRAERRHP